MTTICNINKRFFKVFVRNTVEVRITKGCHNITNETREECEDRTLIYVRNTHKELLF